MKMSNNEKLIPIEPYIDADGWYAKCPICWTEVYPDSIITKCEKCNQLIKWDWMKKYQ